MSGLTLGVYGQQQGYSPQRIRNVLVNTANPFPLGTVKKGQRCELMIRAVPGAPSAAVARVNAGLGGNPSWSVMNEGGRILTEAAPLEIYAPDRAVVVAVQKYDGGGGSNFNAYLYPVDGSNESDRVPPLVTDRVQNYLPLTNNIPVALTIPATANDLMLAWVASPLGANPLPVGGGWTPGGVIQPGANPTVSLWYKLAVGGEPGETWQDLVFPPGPWAVALFTFRVVGATLIEHYGLKYPQSILGFNGVTSPLTFGLWSGQYGKMPPDTRFAGLSTASLQVACFANFGIPYPGAGDIFLAAFPHSLDKALKYGGGDGVANPMLCVVGGYAADPDAIEWNAVNIDPSMFGTPYPFQAGTITLAAM